MDVTEKVTNLSGKVHYARIRAVSAIRSHLFACSIVFVWFVRKCSYVRECSYVWGGGGVWGVFYFIFVDIDIPTLNLYLIPNAPTYT